MAKTGRQSFQFMLRLPDNLRDDVRASAEANNRSMNAEIVERLERSLANWPVVALSAEQKSRAMNYPAEVRSEFEQEVQEFAQNLASIRFPEVNRELRDAYEKLSEFVVLVPTEHQGEIVEAIKLIMRNNSPEIEPKADDDSWPGF